MTDTRERFLTAATKTFAERGFYGTSIAAIAESLPYTKQALLHHFGSKEKLYAEVLKRISDRLMRELEAARGRAVEPEAQLEEAFLEVYRSTARHRDETQLLMRELLDNRRRAETSRSWYLKPFLETLTDMVMGDQPTRFASKSDALAFVYQLLGAITYFVVSEPTLLRMFGRKAFDTLNESYENELRKLIAARLDPVH